MKPIGKVINIKKIKDGITFSIKLFKRKQVAKQESEKKLTDKERMLIFKQQKALRRDRKQALKAFASVQFEFENNNLKMKIKHSEKCPDYLLKVAAASMNLIKHEMEKSGAEVNIKKNEPTEQQIRKGIEELTKRDLGKIHIHNPIVQECLKADERQMHNETVR